MNTSFLQKILLFLLGVFIALIILEVGMRIAGLTIAALQDFNNKIAVHKTGTYRILCIGESTTQHEYPPFLQEILNHSGSSIKFTVIDEGRIGTTSSGIMEHIESWLDEYHPNMVIVMMGINDQGRHIPYEKPTHSQILLWLRSLKTYKLVKFILLNLNEKFRGANLTSVSEHNNEDASGLILKGVDSMSQGYFSRSEMYLKKAMVLQPNNSDVYYNLGILFKRQGAWPEAETYFLEALRLNPKNIQAYCYLAYCLRKQGRFKEAEQYMFQAMRISNGNNAYVYKELGNINLWQGKYKAAEGYFKKAIDLDPHYARTYFELGMLYQKSGELQKAQACIHQALQLDNDHNADFYGAMARISEAKGDKDVANLFYQKTNAFVYTALTIENYQKLKNLLDHRGIQMVCVQYPMRSLKPLRDIFRGQDSKILYVDNEAAFKQGVNRQGYDAYFRDTFAGDFGHCTKMGNQLLAGQIARVILSQNYR